jgi:hypothetical protein
VDILDRLPREVVSKRGQACEELPNRWVVNSDSITKTFKWQDNLNDARQSSLSRCNTADILLINVQAIGLRTKRLTP